MVRAAWACWRGREARGGGLGGGGVADLSCGEAESLRRIYARRASYCIVDSTCSERSEDAAYKFVFMETDKKIEDYDGDGTTMFLWDSIKWYDSYPEVRAITDFVSMNTDYLYSASKDFDDHSYAEHFRFVRMGEDNEDIEEEGWLCSGDIGIRREVSF